MLIEQTDYDKRVIPDKYNTGCKGSLIQVTDSTDISGIKFQNRNGLLVVDYYYVNKLESGTYTIENYDFSKMQLRFYYEDMISDKEINIIFRNCKFGSVSTMRPISNNITYTYNNCTIKHFGGSNSSFNRCRFGDSYVDGLVPFSNVTVKDCYFANFASNDPESNGAHSDAVQMYGYSDSMVQNVLFSHCRFEAPSVKTTKSTAAVNACILLGLEFNNGANIKIEDCILNGGGYTISAGKNEGFVLTNVYFTNLKIGAARLFGKIYPNNDQSVVFTNIDDQDSLYVSSVWNDGNKTHVIVSNDTGEDRTLRIVTGNGTKDYTIKACPDGNKLRYELTDVPFEDFPFDIDISFEDTKSFIICFDVTDGHEKQIRYVSFDGKPTYYAIRR